MQWGFVAGTSSATVTFTYPISCSSVLVLFSIHRYSTSTEQTSFRTEAASYEIPTTSSAQIRLHSHSGGGKYVMLLCKQQWGKSSSSGRATTTVTLPVSMTSAIYAVAISQAAASDTWSTWSSIVSNTQIKLTNDYGPGSWWLVTGKQQWGASDTMTPISVSDLDGYSIAYLLPIAYTQWYQPIGSHPSISSDKLINFTDAYDLSTIKFRFRSGSPMKFISIGIQQWGRSFTSATFPIAFSTTDYCCAVTVGNGQNNNYCASPHPSNFSTTGMSYGDRGYFWVVIGIQQWRNSVSAKATFTYPLAFSVVYIVMLTSTGNNWCWASNITASSAYNDNKSTSCFMALGAQQWGIVTDSANGNQQRMFSFPIAYSDINYSVVVASSYTELTSYGWGYINTKTTTYVTARVAGYTTHFIVIGKQQWGYLSYGTSKFTFPISVTDTNYKVMYRLENAGSEAWYDSHSYTKNRTVTSFEFTGTLQREVLVVGWQQWGQVTTSSGGNGYYIYTFPITFNVPCSVTLGNYGTANTDYSAAYSDLKTTSVRLADNSSVVQFMVIGY